VLTDLAESLLKENRDLDALVSSLPDWGRETPFFAWTIRDQILHLRQVDEFGLTSMRDPDEFDAIFRDVRRQQAAGIELSEQARRAAVHLTEGEILAAWRKTYEAIVERFRASDPKARMTWFGPDMSLMSFAAARQMEVWAHGQDIYDLLGLPRQPTDRLRNICDLGVRTFAWSFRNRGQEPPDPPDVTLDAPSGGTWHWAGAPNGGMIRGSALDFALVVTQRRPVEDTLLEAHGEGARLWLEIAQCFAGAPQARSAPGSRPRL
jgi:uncharacterized protein (TIGR03084 family)